MDKKYYVNREYSWLLFNERILSEAKDKKNPLLERLKFLSITASNLDEFFMVRIASLKDMANAGYRGKDIAGMTPTAQLSLLGKKTKEFVDAQYRVYRRSLRVKLRKEGAHILSAHEDMDEAQAAFADRYFDGEIFPALTPMAADASRSFPLLRNQALHLGVLVKKRKKAGAEFALVQIPVTDKRLVRLPDAAQGRETYIPIEQIIERNIGKLFTGREVICAYPFRLLRNAGLTLAEEEAEDLLQEIEKQLKKRKWGEVVRVDIEEGADKRLLSFLTEALRVGKSAVYEIDGPLDLTFLTELYGRTHIGEAADASESEAQMREDAPTAQENAPTAQENAPPQELSVLSPAPPNPLRDVPFAPADVPELPAGCDIFVKIREGDILLHHPYQSFAPVVSFIEQAAEDADVLAIKQTLYRVSGNSPVVGALMRAARRGKQVTALVELKARFDEEQNIEWAKRLERAGCHVIYGIPRVKVHSKITLVVRREADGARRYLHLGTGNYNDTTARLYTDLGLFTADEALGEDATAFFNMLSGYAEPKAWRAFSVAPKDLKKRFFTLLKRERENAKKGKPARIVAKLNSLCDRDMINALYATAQAGVKIDLIVRGVCCLRAGLPGVSENITVRSIVGRFLEHARIYYFANGGAEEYYLSSADWMPRNLERRVELLFPVTDGRLRERLREILETELSDNMKARMMQPDGSYKKQNLRGKEKRGAQAAFMALYTGGEEKRHEDI